MKVLFLSQGKEINDHPGWHDSLVQLKKEGEITDFLNIPYFGFVEKFGWDSFYRKVVNICKNEQFDLVYFHYFHKKGKPSPKDCIKNLKKLKKAPIVLVSSGDPFSDNWMRPDYPQDFKDASRFADITFSTQMGKAADKMMKWGANNIVFVPNSMCQTRFKADSIDVKNHKFDFDIVFVGSNNSGRIFNPVNSHWFGSQKRKKLVNSLYDHFGMKFGLFGNGWDLPCSQGPIEFNKQQENFKRGRVIVGGNPYSYSEYYSSNRIFFEVSSGIPTIELNVPRLNRILRNNEHLYFAEDIPSLLKKVDSLLERDPNALYEQAGKAAQFVQENHTQYHRMKFKIDTAKRYKLNNRKLDVAFPFFLPEVNLEDEMKFATRTQKI